MSFDRSWEQVRTGKVRPAYDKSWIGWTQEPYGLSNDAPMNAGPPSFNPSAIGVKAEGGQSGCGCGEHVQRTISTRDKFPVQPKVEPAQLEQESRRQDGNAPAGTSHDIAREQEKRE
ncbi:MAG: DUF2141 domain-containing protein [Flavobacteriales bacterium]|nr:DUF2141 domain-containing protein [Flavobacteriales bacterium]MBK7248027.1 DUF2141 domain-containing protein [Flavobacteriales bacterium]MBK7287708.1 DUF2141 domain-containing protein [Flavobacteriales bacterium]